MLNVNVPPAGEPSGSKPVITAPAALPMETILQTLLVLLILASVAVGICYLLLRHRFPSHEMRKEQFRAWIRGLSETQRRVTAVLLISVMAVADFMTLRDMMLGVDVTPFLNITVCTILVVALEGIPTFMGISLAKILDTTVHDGNQRNTNLIGFTLAFIGLIFTFALVLWMRTKQITLNGGVDAFLNQTYPLSGKANPARYIVDCVLRLLPLLTSIFSFIASWLFLHSFESVAMEESLKLARHKNYIAASDLAKDKYRLQIYKSDLWTALKLPRSTMPSETDSFLICCFEKIRQRLTSESLITYPGQLQRYTSSINSQLQLYLETLSAYSSVGDDLRSVPLDDFIRKYNATCKDTKHQWATPQSTDALVNELKEAVDEAQLPDEWGAPLDA